MNSVFVYCEIEEGIIADVSLELLTKGRTLATELGVKLEAIVLGSDLKGVEKQVFPYGVDVLWLGDDKRLAPYTTLPHTSILVNLFKQEKPQIAFMGASSIGRDLGPRVSSALHSGLTADCTSLEIGDYEDKKNNKIYHNLLYQIRPAFGGNIVATIVNPDCRPQMATVREGVMKKEIFNANHQGEIKMIDVNQFTTPEDFVIHVIERHMEKSKVYFTSFKTSFTENLMQKLARLVKTAGIENIDFQDHYAAIKIHFGEYGNLAFLRPNYAKVIEIF